MCEKNKNFKEIEFFEYINIINEKRKSKLESMLKSIVDYIAKLLGNGFEDTYNYTKLSKDPLPNIRRAFGLLKYLIHDENLKHEIISLIEFIEDKKEYDNNDWFSLDYNIVEHIYISIENIYTEFLLS